METIKVPRKLKKAAKKAIQKRFPLGKWRTDEIGICGIRTGKRYTDNPEFYILVGGKAIVSHRMYPR